MRTLILLVLLGALMLPSAFSIGITPPEATINFGPGAEGEFEIMLQNSRDQKINTVVEITGDLAKHFTATNPDVPARGVSLSQVTFSLPDDITPGMHTQRIKYTEELFTSETGMGARTAATVLVRVWKPYPGQYAEIRAVPEHVPAGQDTQMELRIASRGDQSVYGDIDIRIESTDGKLMQSEVLENVQVGANTDWKQYVLIPSRNWPPGKYSIEAEYDYGARVSSASSELKIGTRSLIIQNLTRNFYKDKDVNRFEIDVESMWNEPLTAVSGSLKLGSTSGGTPTITIAGFADKTMVGYWDTDSSLEEGEHPALVTVSFNDGDPVQRTFTVNVFNESVREESPGDVIVVGLDTVLFLMVLIIFVAFTFAHIRNKPRR